MMDIENHQITIYRNPIYLIIIKNFFMKQVSQDILNEIEKDQDMFTEGSISTANRIDKRIRSNIVYYPDTVYQKDRTQSVILTRIDEAIKHAYIHQLLSNAPSPICDLPMTNYSETQVSRYGDDQKYDWHVDTINSSRRWLSLVYYAFKEPREFEGGNICFTNGLTYDSKLVKQEPEPEILSILPENNMAAIFGARTAHMVMPTKAPKNFMSGRFSINCWIGYAN